MLSASLSSPATLTVSVGCSILATPLGVYNSTSREIYWRFITGWIVVSVGVFNVLFGLIAKDDIRKWRHQVKSTQDRLKAEQKGKGKVRRARASCLIDQVADVANGWRNIEQTLSATHFSGKFGEARPVS